MGHGCIHSRCVTGEVDIWPLRGSPDKYSLPFIRDEETNICLNEVDKWYTITNNISACISCSVK